MFGHESFDLRLVGREITDEVKAAVAQPLNVFLDRAAGPASNPFAQRGQGSAKLVDRIHY